MPAGFHPRAERSLEATMKGAMKIPRLDLSIGILLALFVFFTHALSPVSQPYDSRWTIHTATSLLHQGNFDLDEYLPLLEADGFYHIECVFPDGSRIRRIRKASDCAGGHFYHFYPLGVPVMTAPIVASLEIGLHAMQPGLGDWADRHLRSPIQKPFFRGDLIASSRMTELLTASFLIALTAGLFYWLSREWLPRPSSALLALLFAFGSPAWSTGSRALWMHGFSMLLLTLGLLLLRTGRRGGIWPWIAAGAVFCFAVFVRPTNLIPLAMAGLWILWRYRERTAWFALGGAPVFLLFAGIHLSVYHALIPAYSRVHRADEAGLSFGPHVPEALLGNLVSPSRGLLVFLPLVLFSGAGLVLWWRSRENRDWAVLLFAIIVAHYLLISCYEDWYGGHGYGPRYFADITPLLLLPLAACLAKPWRARWAIPFALCAAISIFMHSQGAWCDACMRWDSEPREIRESTWRLWDWKEPMFLRGLRPAHTAAPGASPEEPAPRHSK